MRWECSECGDYVSGARPPNVCPTCGLAVGVFVLAPADDDEESWHRLGAASQPLRTSERIGSARRGAASGV